MLIKCDNPNCNGIALVRVNGKNLCGDCINKLEKIRKKEEEKYYNQLVEED